MIKNTGHLKRALQYICNPEKTMGGTLVYGIGCFPSAENAYETFVETKERFGKQGGRLAYHWEICLAPGESNTDEVLEIAKEWADEILEDKFDCLIAIHDDKQFLHAHLIFNSVSHVDGKKFRYEKSDLEQKLYPVLNRLCVARGLSYVDMTKPEGEKIQHSTYKEWLEQKKGHKTWRDMIRQDVDHAIGLSYSYANFISNLENMGYDVNLNGKHLKVKVPGMEGYARVYSLGNEYTEEQIKEKILNVEPPVRKVSSKVKRYRLKSGKIDKRKTPLTRFQRQYLRYMYLLGKIGRQPYRRITFAERQQAQRIAGQINFLFFHEIHSHKELVERKAYVESELQNIQADKREHFKERKKYDAVFHHAKEWRLSQWEDKTHLEWLQKKGYEGEDGLKRIDEIKEGFTERLLLLRERSTELQQQKKIMAEILNENIETLKWEQELGGKAYERDHITTKDRER